MALRQRTGGARFGAALVRVVDLPVIIDFIPNIVIQEIADVMALVQLLADMLNHPAQLVSTTFDTAHTQSRDQVIATLYLVAGVVEAQQLQHQHFWIFYVGVTERSCPRIAARAPPARI